MKYMMVDKVMIDHNNQYEHLAQHEVVGSKTPILLLRLDHHRFLS